jgi:hypothetical protein
MAGSNEVDGRARVCISIMQSQAVWLKGHRNASRVVQRLLARAMSEKRRSKSMTKTNHPPEKASHR